MIIDIIAGARPNFMKIAPIIEAMKYHLVFQAKGLQYRLIHTGQHYDKNMSEQFFEQLGIPAPHVNLGAGGGSQAEQTAAILIGYEKLLIQKKSDLCIVVGDVTSTMACTITAKKMGIRVAHVEAGIRSYDMAMPEEINRMVTDAICDYFFTTSESANQNLLKAGIRQEQIFFVGNTMIDTLLKNIPKLVCPAIWEQKELDIKSYLVLTLHRPSNVDEPEKLANLLKVICERAKGSKIIFPVHPRTRKFLSIHSIQYDNLVVTEPLGYLEFIFLVKNCRGVITDSGGITEEATVMNVPCITLRNNTERPETCTIGTNELVGDNFDKLSSCLDKIIAQQWKKGGIPILWDGKTSKRIVDVIISFYESGVLKPSESSALSPK